MTYSDPAYKIEDIRHHGPFDRDVQDSHGRPWKFVQDGEVHNSYPATFSHLRWTCQTCGCSEPVKVSYVVHDEVIVKDPIPALDAHDCDESRVREIMGS